MFTESSDDGSKIGTSTNDVTTLGGYEQDDSECFQVTSADAANVEQTVEQAHVFPATIGSFTFKSAPFNLGPEPNTEQSQQLVHDFWLIVTVKEMNACVYFHERQKNLHQKLFGQLTEEIKHQMRIVNQEALLEDMCATKKCSNLLLHEAKSGNTFTGVYTQNSSGDDSSVNPGELPFSSGSFACLRLVPMVSRPSQTQTRTPSQPQSRHHGA